MPDCGEICWLRGTLESFLDDAFTHSVYSGWDGCYKSMNEQQFVKILV